MRKDIPAMLWNQEQIWAALTNSSLQYEHTPRLLTAGADPKRWWADCNASPPMQPILDEIRREAAKLLDEPMPELTLELFRLFEQHGERLPYEQVYFARRKRLNTFAFLSLLEPDEERYRKELHDAIWSLLNEYTWCLPAHLKENELQANLSSDAYSLSERSRLQFRPQYRIDLFSAETAFALSEILRLTEDTLPDLLKSRICEEVYRRIFWPMMHDGPFGWETATHNWASVCAGSIGAAAIHLMRDPAELAALLAKLLPSIDSFLSGYGEDGACMEGYGYWVYGFSFYVLFADLLKQRTDGAINLLHGEKVRQIALFQQKCFLSQGCVANFSDSLPSFEIHLGLSHYLSRLYPEMALPAAELRSGYLFDHCHRWAHLSRNLLWTRPEENGAPWPTASYYLSDAQWVISRSVLEEGTFGFAAKGGHNDEPHNHNDVGHFILHADDETYLSDLGCGLYTAGYFGAARYTYACNGAQGHSVPIIDGQLQVAGAAAKAHVLRVETGPAADRLELDLTAAYALPQLERLTRRLHWEKSDSGLPALLLEDAYTFAAVPETVAERFICSVKPVLHEQGLIVLQGKHRLAIRYAAAEAEPCVEDHLFVDHFGREQVYWTLDLQLKPSAPQLEVQLSFTFEA
ncbi:heparinase II/III family protein [Paenibacillus sp. y28]|uniref:heparinase II/III family protein n=1 Tax=Paenibacillus sp. y28 TaxID=3129110 RepID=UPI0030164893